MREIAGNVVKPRANGIEESAKFPVDMAKRYFEEGYLHILVPKELGRMGKDVTSYWVNRSSRLPRTMGLKSYAKGRI